MDTEEILISQMFKSELIRCVEGGNLVPDVCCDHKHLLEEFGEPLNIPALDLVLGDYVGHDKRLGTLKGW